MAARKMAKDLATKPGSVIIEVVGGKKGKMTFDFNKYPKNIQTKLGPFGLSSKLGDGAAGKSGVEAEEAIIAIDKGLMENKWTTKVPAGPKVSVAALAERVSKLSGKDAETAKALLEKLGVQL